MARTNRTPDGARVLHLDTFAGIAGDMFLAALLDAGLSRKALEEGLAPLELSFSLRVRRVRRGALSARRLRVVGGEKPVANRRYREIRELLRRAGLPPAVRERAGAIFHELARAEARVHGIPVDAVHFHEVGAVDALVDIVGAAVAVESLGVERITAAPPALGEGAVETEHGTLPLPAPATLALLEGIPVRPAHVSWETVTPTGAALLRGLVDEFRSLPEMIVERVGYGAGGERPGPMPNVLRAVLGRGAFARRDRVTVIDAQIDDLSPEHFEYVLERLHETGALDVSISHTVGKKNRPGFALRVLCRPSAAEAVAARVFHDTTSLGLRSHEVDRFVLDREVRRVTTRFGRVRVKLTRGPSGALRASAEYDDCKRLARRHDVPIREIAREAEALALG